MTIRYAAPALASYYAQTRMRWSELYPSERHVLSTVIASPQGLGHVLDAGCAQGGLGSALMEVSTPESYTGIDIHDRLIEQARTRGPLPCPSEFIRADILECDLGARFDTVVSLGCADWNTQTEAILHACWRHVRPGGSFIVSIRLSPEQGVNDPARSYQLIDGMDESAEPSHERANYVVFTLQEILALFSSFPQPPARLHGYGYWGRPSASARTPYERLVFSVFRLDKPSPGQSGEPAQAELLLPLDFLTAALARNLKADAP